jgi:hypothetical protein
MCWTKPPRSEPAGLRFFPQPAFSVEDAAGPDRGWTKTDLPAARRVPSARPRGTDFAQRPGSNRALGSVFRDNVLAIVREWCADFGPALAAKSWQSITAVRSP